MRSLDFPGAARALAASMDDRADALRPQYSDNAGVEMIALIAGGPSPAIFKQVLEALDTLIAARQFKLAIRRITQALALEDERFSAPQVPTPPDWQGVNVRAAFPALAPLEDALTENLALLEGYAAGAEKAVDIASSLITAKKGQLAALQAKLAAAMALFGQGLNGAGVYALHVNNVGGTALLRSELTTAGNAPGPELSYCAGVCWVAPKDALATLAGILGV